MTNPEEQRNIPAYIGKKSCGCIVAACVDDGRFPEETKRNLKEFIDDGLIIERVTVGYVNDHGFLKCAEHNVKQLELF